MIFRDLDEEKIIDEEKITDLKTKLKILRKKMKYKN